ncbi:MAG: PilT/PilU family type 4a pilus ATPase [Nanoarchaeota archaeon]|nr:PilT/PilU family type 4a pilus ATPase [Nanoarchaeota archaeon]
MSEDKKPAVDIREILAEAVRLGASDVHLQVGLPPVTRLNEKLNPLPEMKDERLTRDSIKVMAYSIMTNAQKSLFEKDGELDLMFGIAGAGRFRGSIFMEDGNIGMVFRHIPNKIPTLDDLNLPVVIGKIAQKQRGLVLVTGTTGSGKSSTLAAMIDIINNTQSRHIVTIEDPIEFKHRPKKCIIRQRAVGLDTPSFSSALRRALRQDPDVILIGEMRDNVTIETALTAAETGHLVLSTLHTRDATQTIERIIMTFPDDQRNQVRLQLAANLEAVICQRLVLKADRSGLIPAVEILVTTERVRALIEDKDQTKRLIEAIASGKDVYGMQTFDQSLLSLWRNKVISMEDALKAASNLDDLKLKMSGVCTSDEDIEPSGDKGSGGSGGTGSDELKIERF